MRLKIRLKFLCFLLLSFALYWLAVESIFLPHYHLAGIRAKLKAEYNQTQIPRDEVDYLILGDSSALYALNPMRMGEKSYSAAGPGASVALSTELFKKIGIKKINKGVILMQTFIDPHYDEDLWKIFVPQKIMDSTEVLNFFCGKYTHDCSLFEKYSLHVKYLMHRLHLNGSIVSTIAYGLKSMGLINSNSFINYVKDSILKHHGHYPAPKKFNLDDEEFYSSYWKSFSKKIRPPVSELYALEELAELTKKYGVNLYLIHPQLYRAEKIINLKNYNNSYNDFIHSHGKLNFHYIDFEKMNLVLPKEQYRDISHLNEEGANVLTDEIFNYIEGRK